MDGYNIPERRYGENDARQNEDRPPQMALPPAAVMCQHCACDGVCDCRDNEELRNANVDFIRQVFDPLHYSTAPPSFASPVSKQESITATLTTKVVRNTVTNTAWENNQALTLADNKGVILWFPRDCVGTMAHYAFLPVLSLATNTGLFNTKYTVFPDYLNVPASASAVIIGGVAQEPQRSLAALRFNENLYLPYTGTSKALTLAPDFAAQARFARGYGGVASLWSNTVGISATALAGNFSTAVLETGIDMTFGSANTEAYGSAKMKEAVRKKSEYISDVTGSVGVTNIQGPDMNVEFCGVGEMREEAAFQDITPLSWAGGTTTSPIVTRLGVAGQGPQQIPVFSRWISPYSSQILDVPGGSPGNTPTLFPTLTSNSSFGDMRIPEHSCLDVHVRFPCTIGVLDNVGDPSTFSRRLAAVYQLPLTVVTVAMHIFAYVEDNGNVQFNHITDISREAATALGMFAYTGNFPSYGTAREYGSTGMFTLHSSVRDRWIARGGVSGFGKYVGCRVFGFLLQPESFRSLTTEDPFSAPENPIDVNWIFENRSSGNLLQVRCADLFAPGKQGPVHVLKYDDVSIGQNVNFDASLNIQSVLKASLMNLAQAAILTGKRAADLNIYALLYALFADESRVQCSWKKDVYQRFVEEYIENFDLEKFINLFKYNNRIMIALKQCLMSVPDKPLLSSSTRRQRGQY